jgi:hypothetical protein
VLLLFFSGEARERYRARRRRRRPASRGNSRGRYCSFKNSAKRLDFWAMVDLESGRDLLRIAAE